MYTPHFAHHSSVHGCLAVPTSWLLWIPSASVSTSLISVLGVHLAQVLGHRSVPHCASWGPDSQQCRTIHGQSNNIPGFTGDHIPPTTATGPATVAVLCLWLAFPSWAMVTSIFHGLAKHRCRRQLTEVFFPLSYWVAFLFTAEL